MPAQWRYRMVVSGDQIADWSLPHLVKLVKAANLFCCAVLIRYDGGVLDAKSLIEISRIASHHLSHLTFEIAGPNAMDCFELLSKIVISNS